MGGVSSSTWGGQPPPTPPPEGAAQGEQAPPPPPPPRRPPGPATRFKRVKPIAGGAKGADVDKKLPVVMPKQACRLRELRMLRVRDYLELEMEYPRRAIAARPEHDDGDKAADVSGVRADMDKVKRLRGSPLLVANVVECVDDYHLIVTAAGSSREWYVPVLSFANVELIGPHASALTKVPAGAAGAIQPSAIVGVLPPEMEPADMAGGFLVDKAPTESYDDIGGLEAAMLEVKEALELPLTSPELYTDMGISPPNGVILYGPPGGGKTLLAKAVANVTSATFLRCVGSQLIQRTSGEGCRMVRALFQVARDHAPSIVFIDEIDAIGYKRYETISSGEKEVQRVLLELLNQLDGFDSRGDVKVILATNRIETLDPALIRPGRVDRKIEVPLPDEPARRKIFDIHSRSMTLAADVSYAKVFAKDDVSGADIKAVCTEAGMRALRARRTFATLQDFKDAVACVTQKNEQKHEAFFL